MFVRSKNYDNAIQKVRINVGTLVGLEKDDEAFLVLKELPTKETIVLKEKHSEGLPALIEFFESVLPSIIVEHNFYETEQKKMSNDDVVKLVFEKTELSSKVLTEYANASFFTQGSKNADK